MPNAMICPNDVAQSRSYRNPPVSKSATVGRDSQGCEDLTDRVHHGGYVDVYVSTSITT